MDIPEYTKKVFNEFDRMRGKHVGNKFWDMVVVTASDEAQAHAYRQQILSKKEKNELPLIEYPVFHDPPGPKVGCGGCTMYVITKLYEEYGEELWKKRILLLNAGGQSQRLPSSSILGKIFMAMPIRDPMYQIFEVKLACYVPLLKHMKPGFFHAPADTIEVYDLGSDSDNISFDRPGFTALAHPSSLEIGRTHGVYVLEEKDEDKSLAAMKSCLEVLQKPSVERMRERGAVLHNAAGEEIAYTDSCFYFDHEVSKRLMNFYLKEPVQCEIDGYGDFLQCLGPRATDAYTSDLKNVSKVEPSLEETRKKVYRLLKDLPIHVALLKASKFYHFGTMPEYIENMTDDPVVATELGYQQQVFSHVVQSTSNGIEAKRKKLECNIEGTLMHSILENPCTTVGKNCVVEYCQFTPCMDIKPGCIISNCQVLASKEDLVIPSDTFMHTAWISHNGVSKAVTVSFGVKDNVKKKVEKENLQQLVMFGKSFDAVMKSAGVIDPEFSDKSSASLWSAQIFPAADTMTKSFLAAYSMFFSHSSNVGEGDHSESQRGDLYSFQDIVKSSKDADKMLTYRGELFKEIQANRRM